MIPNCQTQVDDNNCSKCEVGYYLSQGECVEGDVHCVEYGEDKECW